MGNSEETKPSKPVKPSSPPLDQANNIHVYPDWAAIQEQFAPASYIKIQGDEPVGRGRSTRKSVG